MPKEWDDLTVEEKFDSLRRDVARLLSAYQDVDRRLAAAGLQLGRIDALASKTAQEVGTLKDRLSTILDSE